jgi:hypothetical protein
MVSNLTKLISPQAQNVKNILMKPTCERSEAEVLEVANILINVELFKNFKRELMTLVRFMKIETYSGKKVIVEQGSHGDKFYYLLSG